jgi:hypothetical protein
MTYYMLRELRLMTCSGFSIANIMSLAIGFAKIYLGSPFILPINR